MDSVIKPQNWTAKPAPVPPVKADLDALRVATIARIKAIVTAKGTPMPYYDVIKQLERDGFTSPWVDNAKFIEEVHKEWTPNDFDPKAVDPEKVEPK
jgi:hypothetical protein